LPGGYFYFYYALFITIGCFIYPVINLITIAALDNVSKKAIGTAAGFIGLLGYTGKLVEYKWIGKFVDEYSPSLGAAGAWNVVLLAIFASSVLAAILLGAMWKLRPLA
jgi:OPA family glycerol-3-phosphate transporter-like MFS transporter